MVSSILRRLYVNATLGAPIGMVQVEDLSSSMTEPWVLESSHIMA